MRAFLGLKLLVKVCIQAINSPLMSLSLAVHVTIAWNGSQQSKSNRTSFDVKSLLNIFKKEDSLSSMRWSSNDFTNFRFFPFSILVFSKATSDCLQVIYRTMLFSKPEQKHLYLLSVKIARGNKIQLRNRNDALHHEQIERKSEKKMKTYDFFFGSRLNFF